MEHRQLGSCRAVAASFELELLVEVILDRTPVAAGHEDQMLDPGLACLVHDQLDGRPIDDGSISFSTALVAGRKRVPRPATGKTALRIGLMVPRVAGMNRGGMAGGDVKIVGKP